MPVVLILDDRVTNRSVYARLAASVDEGVQVEVFADPQAALDWLDDRFAGRPAAGNCPSFAKY